MAGRPGAKSERLLCGLAVVGGLVFSQMLTLYVTPVFYVVLEHWQERRAAKKIAVAAI